MFRGELRLNVIRATQTDEQQPDRGDHRRRLIHVALGYALVTGLAYNVGKKVVEDLKTFDVEEEPPPPPDEPPPPPEQIPDTPPPIVAPPPIVRTNTAPPPMIVTPVAPPPQITVAPPPPPAAAAGAQGRAGESARQPRVLYLQRRLSVFGAPQRGAGHDRLPPRRRSRRPSQRMHGDRVERVFRAGQRDLPLVAQPSAIHAGDQTAPAPRPAIRSAAESAGGSRRTDPSIQDPT